MERVRTVSRAGVVVIALLAFTASGCMSPEKVSTSFREVSKTVGLNKPAPASQVACFWQRRIVLLPDPLRDGSQTPGLVGQVFLISPDATPADPAGDLAIAVFDDTPRPPGSPEKMPEIWHYTKDTLSRMATNDERFGKSYAIFLPWPPHWNDVTAIKVKARYQSPGNPDIYAQEVKLNLDFTDPATAISITQNRNAPRGSGQDLRTVPDANKIAQSLLTPGSNSVPLPNLSTGAPNSGIVSAGHNSPAASAPPSWPNGPQANPSAGWNSPPSVSQGPAWPNSSSTPSVPNPAASWPSQGQSHPIVVPNMPQPGYPQVPTPGYQPPAQQGYQAPPMIPIPSPTPGVAMPSQSNLPAPAGWSQQPVQSQQPPSMPTTIVIPGSGS